MSTHTGAVDCAKQCTIPEGLTMTDVPMPRHDWSDGMRCPNEGCGRAFLMGGQTTLAAALGILAENGQAIVIVREVDS